MEYPIGPVPLLLFAFALWSIKSTLAEKTRLTAAGILLVVSFWSFIFALLSFVISPLWVVTVVSQLATVALTWSTIHFFNLRTVPNFEGPLFSNTGANWLVTSFFGAAYVVALNYFSLEMVGPHCYRRCQVVAFFVGYETNFMILYLSTFMGALGLSAILASIVQAYKQFKIR